MAFQAKDGSKHTNHSTMKAADAHYGAGKPAPEEHNAPEEGESQNDGAQVAEEHGPAQVIDIQHDHEGGRHVVHATHPDGHEHETEHASAGEAHKFAADCAGGM